ncbi:MAG: DUF2225 domain-containing protein [Lachnotalea sp.]
MSNLLSGLAKFGLGNLENEKLFEEDKKVVGNSTEEKATKETVEEDLLFDKSYRCPVCEMEFKSKTVRTGKPKLLGTDYDLRAKYQGIDPLKYDIVSCPKCGYTTVTRFFNTITSPQASLIKEKISKNFKATVNNDATISYEAALESHKLALVNAIVKKCRSSEKAYICLKIGWLIRGQREALDSSTPDYAEVVAKSEAEELEFIKNAYEGFSAAVSKEEFPMCGMDESTMDYLLASLACKCKQYEMASRLVSNVITSRVAKNNLKDKARELKDVILKERKED